MTDTKAQAEKKAPEQKTADVASEDQDRQQREEQARSAAEKALQVPRAESAIDPYPNYDVMTLEQLQALADERGVEVNRDVLRAHLITELRAADSGAISTAARRGAR